MRNFFIFVALLILPGIAISAPSISGVANNGTTAVISGSSFGAKTTATPLIWETFDSNDTGRQHNDNLKGENCSDYGVWVDSSTDFIPIYTNQNNRANSSLAGYHHHDITAEGGDVHAPASIVFAESHQTTLFLSLWIRYTWSTWDTTGGNYKMYRINSGLEPDTYTSLQVGSGNSNPDRGFFMLWSGTSFKSWPSASGTPTTLNFTYENDGVWEQHVVLLKAGTSGVADGSAIVYRDGVKLEDTTAMTTWQTPTEWKKFTIGWDVVNYDTGQWTMYTDDIALDNSWLQVFMGDSATWAACTKRVFQQQTNRTDTNIGITVNQDTWSLGQTAYVYVMDSGGSVNSSGYSFTFAVVPQSASTMSVTGTSAFSATGTTTFQ